MKKILQDLSFAELESLVLELGEKKFRAKQLYEGLLQGKKITENTVQLFLTKTGTDMENIQMELEKLKVDIQYLKNQRGNND